MRAGRLIWYVALLAGVVPALLLGFLASGFADRPIFAGWGLALALAYALLLRRGFAGRWGAWMTAGRCLLLLALGAAAWTQLVLRYGEELDLGLRGVLPALDLSVVARPRPALASVTALAVTGALSILIGHGFQRVRR
jgi:hypothetical protein